MCLSSGTKKNQYLYILFSIDKRNYNFEWIDFTYTVCNKVLHSLEVVVQSGLNMEKNSLIKGTKCLQKSKETTLTYWRNIFWAPKIAIFCGNFLSALGYITSHIISLISVFLIPYNTTHDMFWSNLFSSFSFTYFQNREPILSWPHLSMDSTDIFAHSTNQFDRFGVYHSGNLLRSIHCNLSTCIGR